MTVTVPNLELLGGVVPRVEDLESYFHRYYRSYDLTDTRAI